MRNPRLLPGEALTIMQSVRSIGCSSHWVPAAMLWRSESSAASCACACLHGSIKAYQTVNLFPLSIYFHHSASTEFLASSQPSLSSRASECLESWALELECGMMVDTWIRIQPFFWQGKNWNKQRRVFLVVLVQRYLKAIIDNYNYNILQYCHSSFYIISIIFCMIVIQILCHFCNGPTYISSEFLSKSPCWSQPPRLHGRASQLTMNFWGVDVERVKVLDQPMTKTQNSILVILASLLSPPATATRSITSECNLCSVCTRHYQYVLL